MQRELAAHIRIYLARLSEDLGYESSANISEIFAKFRNFEVTECPFPEDGLLSSNVAIAFAGQHAGKLDRVPHPPELAEKFASYLNSTGLFQVQVGGPGHLNVIPTRSFFARYLRSMLGDSDFFEHFRLVTVTEPHASLFAADEAAGKRIVVNLLDLISRAEEKLQGNERSAGFDLEGAGLLAARFSLAKDRDDALMALALISDPDCDSAPYLQGLKGSENFPWFIHNVRKYADSYPSRGVEEPFLSFCTDVLLGVSSEHVVLHELIRGLAHFRSQLGQSLRQRSAQRLIVSLFAFARLFSTAYNRPESRDRNSTVSHQLGQLTPAVSRAIQSALNSLQFSCDP